MCACELGIPGRTEHLATLVFRAWLRRTWRGRLHQANPAACRESKKTARQSKFKFRRKTTAADKTDAARPRGQALRCTGMVPARDWARGNTSPQWRARKTKSVRRPPPHTKISEVIPCCAELSVKWSATIFELAIVVYAFHPVHNSRYRVALGPLGVTRSLRVANPRAGNVPRCVA